MCDDWTKCEQCKFFDPNKYYCNRMLRTVTIGCPYGEDKITMVVAERGAGRKTYEEQKKKATIAAKKLLLSTIYGVMSDK